MVLNCPLLRNFQVSLLPTVVLIDQNGWIRWEKTGPLTEKDIRKANKKALEASSAKSIQKANEKIIKHQAKGIRDANRKAVKANKALQKAHAKAVRNAERNKPKAKLPS